VSTSGEQRSALVEQVPGVPEVIAVMLQEVDARSGVVVRLSGRCRRRRRDSLTLPRRG
jgi:hypothetical protein